MGRHQVIGGFFAALLLGCGDDGTAAEGGEQDGSTAGESDPTASGSTGTGSGSGSDTDSGVIVDDFGNGTSGAEPYPPPGDWPPNTGPGGPSVAFGPDDLYVTCAFLDGGPSDPDHHNLAVMFDGYLLLPWAPDYASGGMSFFDISDPCNPQMVGTAVSTRMRETHAVGFAEIDGKWWAVVNHKDPGLLGQQGGIQFWDVTNPATPKPVKEMKLPGFSFLDAYQRVTLSVFWQVPYVYVSGADNGVYVVDASDPTDPQLVHQYNFEPVLRSGTIHAVGNLLITTAAEGPRTVMLDISIPDLPQPIAGGDFDILDATQTPREAYFENIEGGYIYYAIKSGGGGLLIYDIHDPTNPTYVGNYDSGGDGGYVFVKEGLAFEGESNFAQIYDVSDPADIQPVAQLMHTGDLDTITPIGNVAVLSVDEDAVDGESSAIQPYLEAVDATPPRVTWSVPEDGATDLAVTSRVGVTFNEMVDVKSAWEGSVRLYRSDLDPTMGRVDGIISVQENVVNFAPVTPLQPGTTYTLEIPADGIVDYNGNAVAEPYVISFTTAGG